MPEQGAHIIEAIARKWSRNNLLALLLKVLAISLLLAVAGKYLFNAPLWTIGPLFVVLAAAAWSLKLYKVIIPSTVVSHLNRTYPQLEESAHLFLLPAGELGLLQKMQQQKIGKAMQAIPVPGAVAQPLKRAVFVLLCAVAGSAAMAGVAYLLPARHSNNPISPEGATTTVAKPETVLPGIGTFQITVTPPAYTGRSTRQQNQFSLQVEEGSGVQWNIHTTHKVNSLQLLLNNKETIALQPANTDSTTWTLQKTIHDAGFYQVSLDGKPSQLYTLEVMNDLPVRISIITPKQYTTIEPGTEPRTKLTVQLTDDYGITRANIVATMASGKGESVSFKEQTLEFTTRLNNQSEIELTKLLDLPALGLHPGDELYFYVKAQDNHGQESRSDMYFISLPDTAELFSMSGMESGVSQVPEYFRSQRQLIMDTEKLLKEQATVSSDTFKTRSNHLGEDQKLLRLRYGKFLGEEYESGGHSPNDGHDHDGGVEPADIDALIDQYAHKHDNAEDASYFEPAQKAQLKAILTEMWSSELQLRTYFPKESLPYQYKALRLLKDMQQKSRVYVGKTSVKMPPLRPDKRLTGEVEKVTPVNDKKNNEKTNTGESELQQAMAVIEQLKKPVTLLPAAQALLLVAERAISEKAIHAPGDYLNALNAIRAIREEPAQAGRKQVALAQAALQKIIRSAETAPQKEVWHTSSGLETYYYKNLQNSKR
jgi:hypothetical protein